MRPNVNVDLTTMPPVFINSISRKLASNDTQRLCVCIQVSHSTQHSPDTQVFSLTLSSFVLF